MRVLLQPKIVNQNQIQTKSSKNFQVSTPLKSDAVSFSGEEKVVHLVSELLNGLKKVKSNFFYEEAYTTPDSSKTVIKLGDNNRTYELIYLLEEGRTNIFKKYKKQPHYRIKEKTFSNLQELSKNEFEKLTAQLKSIAVKKILKKHGLEAKSIPELLKGIGSKMASDLEQFSDKVSHGADQIEGVLIEKETFNLGKDQFVTLCKVLDKDVFKIAIGDTPGRIGDAFYLTDKKEIGLLKQVLGLLDAIESKRAIVKKEATLLEALEKYRAKMPEGLEKANSAIENAKKPFDK